MPTSGEYALKAVNTVDLFSCDPTKLLQSELLYPSEPCQADMRIRADASGDIERKTPVTMWLIGDLDSSDGLALVRNALQHLALESTAARLGFVHVPTSKPSGQSSAIRLSTLLFQLYSQQSLSALTPVDMLTFVEELVKSSMEEDNLDSDGHIYSEEAQKVLEARALKSFTSAGWSVTNVAAAAEFWQAGSTIAQTLDIKSGQTYILINGRVSFAIVAGHLVNADPSARWAHHARHLPARGLCRP